MNDMFKGAKNATPLPPKPPKLVLLIRLKDDSPKEEREAVIDGIRNLVPQNTAMIVDTRDVVSSTQVALNILTFFFNFVSIIAVILCFFVLWLSFIANVRENSWEFGVLRAVGLDVSKVIRMYIYEAICLILSAVVIGTVIGMIVSITLTLQFTLFTELAFTFDFPYILFTTVFVMSLTVAVLGSWIPARYLKEKDIASALKNM